METKQKIVKTAKVCGIIAKVLYLLACVECVTLIVLAIVLPKVHPLDPLTPKETAVQLATLALQAFVLIGLLWNVEGIFKTIAAEQTPFAERVGHYLKKTAIFTIVLAVVPAIVGTSLAHILCKGTELVFPTEAGGVVIGVVLLLIGVFFKYGNELQKRDDETL